MEQSCHPLVEEERLVARCLRGDASAWDSLYQRYNPRLLIIIRSFIGSGTEHADEIASEVWSSLYSDEGYSRLRRYNPEACRLLYYLAAVARRAIWRRRRSDRSRSMRECKVARNEATWDELGRGLVLNEFLATLTGREREFCLSELLKQAQVAIPAPVSPENAWKLRSRILKKFQTYFLGCDQ